MNPEAIRAMIDQAMLRNLTNSDKSHSFERGPTRPVQSVRACSYFDFMKCQPLNFRGTKGVVGLSRWYEKMELVFHISGCAIENQVKFATCTMLDAALTWWNGHLRTLGRDAAYVMTWETLKKQMTDKYYPRGEIKKLEIELWNLKVKGNDVVSYTQRFRELALMCTKFISDEKEKVDKYIGGLPDNIHGNVMSVTPKTLDEAIETTKKIVQLKIRIQAARDRQKSYADLKCKPMDFQVRPFKVLSKVRDATYRLELPQQLSRIHNTFHVSNLKKCLSDESLVIPLDELYVDDKLHFVEEPVDIMDREIKQLKRSRIPIIKSKPNEKLIYNSIMHGPYVRQMTAKTGDPYYNVPIAETLHEHDKLTNKEVKQMEVHDQAI
nr:reverse transcriptase domain-containing protein [Tanacetum cinerariifolium]